MNNINKVIVTFFFLALVISQLMVLFGSGTDDKIYMGISHNVVDTNTYFSYMQQAKEGHLLFTNKYTSEAVPYIIFNPVFLVIGWLSFVFKPTIAYYIFKFAFLLIFAYLVYNIVELCVKKNEINISYFFVLFGSGIGYVFLILANLGFKRYGSIDYWISESNSVAVNLAPVHFAVSVCLMILIVIYYYKFWQSRNLMNFLIFSSSTLLLGFIHLFDVITLIPVFGVYTLFRLLKKKEKLKDIVKYNFVYAIIAVIPFIYTYNLYALNPFFKEWNNQNVLDSPEPLHVIFGFLMPLSFAAAYFLNKFLNKKKFEEMEIILFAWILSGFALLYSPLNIQRRFIEGLHIPIMILGSLGFLRVILPYLQSVFKLKNVNKMATFAVLLLISPTSFYWLYQTSASISKNIEVNDYSIPYSLNKEEIEALEWLRTNTNREDVILSSYAIGNYIPRISGNRVFLGHWAQTIDFEKKKTNVDRFFSSNDDNFRKGLIDGNNIRYIYYGVDEKMLNQNFTPPYNSDIVFQNIRVIIYKIK